MTEKEKMQSQKLYDANYDSELERERIECKALCQEYNHLPIKETEKRSRLIKKILGKREKKFTLNLTFGAITDIVYRQVKTFMQITDWLCLMQAEFLSGIMCSLLRIADSIHRDIRLISRGGIGVWNMHIN